MTMVETHVHDADHRRDALDRIPRTARWALARRRAEELTEAYRTPPIPALEIAEQNGVDVIFADFGQHSEKVAGFCDFANARLYVNREDRPERQFFTIAHEFGHWILHREIFLQNPDKYPVLPRYQSVDSHSPMEKEANFFAANLLVPERLLRPVINAPLSSLTTIFRVSRTMMEHRINNVRR